MKTLFKESKSAINWFLAAALCVMCVFICTPSKAISPYTQYTWGQINIPSTLGTNATVQFTNGPSYTVTNADGSIYTNTTAPQFISAQGMRNVALEFLVSSDATGFSAAGATNSIYWLAPVVKTDTNTINLPTTYGTTTNTVKWPPTNHLWSYNTNQWVKILVPLCQQGGVVQDWATNIDSVGYAGWYVVQIQNQAANNLITNVLLQSVKTDAL